MPARLFCRIQSFFSRFNKTVLLAIVVLATIAISTSTTFAALTDTDLKNTYANYFSNFTISNDGKITSGLTGGTVQNSATNNNAVGLVFSVNLGINSGGTGDDPSKHWANVAVDPASFVIKLCLDSDPTKCWLNTVDNQEVQDTDPGIIYRRQTSGIFLNGDFTDGETVPVATFNSVNPNGERLLVYNPSTNVASDVGGLVLTKGAPLTATLWYCASGNGAKAADAYKTNGVATNSPTKFGSLCKGASYFQIGAPLSFTIPADAATIQQQTTASQTTLATGSTVNSSTTDNLPKCALNHPIDGTVNGCAAELAFGLYQLTAYIAGLFGKLFDFFIGYSLSDASYRLNFAVTGWKLVRDISNVFFIIIMVYTGFSAVFNTSNTSMKKVVPSLIVNALLINFSLFATRLVIDLSNITARMFYSEMIVCDKVNLASDGTCPPAQAKRGPGGYWPLSEKIVSSFNPQTIFSSSILIPPSGNAAGDAGTINTNATTAGASAPISQRDYANYFAIVSVIAAAIMVAVSIMFFKVAFLFLGRIVGLYICLIFSPFAFLSRDMPMLGGIARLRWSDWTKELTNYALLGPVFVFFLYIIYILLSSSFVQQIGYVDPSGSFFGIVLSIVIPMLLVYFLMQAAQKSAEQFSGQIGKAVQGIGSTVTGLALGAATGGAAFLGSSTLGRLANNTANSESFKDWAANNGRFGRLALKSVNSIGKSSFDARNTIVGTQASKQLGVNMDNKFLSSFNLDTKSTKGGYNQKQEDIVKAGEEYKKLLVTKKSDDEIKATYSQQELLDRDAYDKTADRELRASWLKKLRADAKADGKILEVADYNDNAWKKYKEGGKTKAAYEKAKDSYQKTVPPNIWVTAAEKNKARTNAYAEYKEKQSGGAFANQDYYNKQKNLVAKKGEVLRNPYADDDLYDKDGVKIASKRDKIASKNGWQALQEAGEGAAKGIGAAALAGAVTGSAILPGYGTAAGIAAGAAAGAIRELLKYSGVTNKRIGGAIRTEPKKQDKLIKELLDDAGAGDGGAGAGSKASSNPPGGNTSGTGAAGGAGGNGNGSNNGGNPPPATP